MTDNAIIALASILGAAFSISIGSIGPAIGEARALAQALQAIAQQPANAVCRHGDGRINGHLLFRGGDDSDLRQSVLGRGRRFTLREPARP